MNLAGKLGDPGFCRDVVPMLRPGVEFSPATAAEVILDVLAHRIG